MADAHAIHDLILAAVAVVAFCAVALTIYRINVAAAEAVGDE